ncbi:MAG: hypothetical protein OEY11_12270 [Gammaproteobacteria bacterium]|nr:hypothetical protein [Gammaproteobacteria bacterium]
METFESKYFSGQGAVYVAPRDVNGKPQGLMFIGDASAVDMTPNIDTKEKLENVSGARGVAASWISRSDFGLAITMDSIKAEHLAIALHGVVTVKAAGSVTDEAHTAYLDKFTPLENNNVSTVVVTGAGGTPTYVEATDYIVHAEAGLIEFISGGTITDATPVLIDYDFGAQKHIKIEPNNDELYMVFAGINTADNNKQTRCELYKVKLTPGALSMISDDSSPIPITGKVILDSLRPAGDQFYSWKTQD